MRRARVTKHEFVQSDECERKTRRDAVSDKFFEALEKAKVTDAALERVADLERQLKEREEPAVTAEKMLRLAAVKAADKLLAQVRDAAKQAKTRVVAHDAGYTTNQWALEALGFLTRTVYCNEHDGGHGRHCLLISWDRRDVAKREERDWVQR